MDTIRGIVLIAVVVYVILWLMGRGVLPDPRAQGGARA